MKNPLSIIIIIGVVFLFCINPAMADKARSQESVMYLMKEFLPNITQYKDWRSGGLSKFYTADSDDNSDDSTAGTPKSDSPASLWEYINGAAEIYHHYSFEMLLLKRYQHTKLKNSEITVEIYRMSNPLNAFGIYSYERSGITEFVDVRQEGYYVKNALTFWRGNYYVKLSIYGYKDKNGALLIKMANEISGLIIDITPPPAEIYYFPEKEKTSKTAIYIPNKLLGLRKMGSGFTANYTYKGKTFKLLLKILKTEDEAEDILAMLKKFLKRSGKNIEPPDSWDEDEVLAYKNSMMGNLIIFIKDNFLGGVIELDDTNEGFPVAKVLYDLLK